eukprot:13166637-Alexandrium_andersonii.AAC.1
MCIRDRTTSTRIPLRTGRSWTGEAGTARRPSSTSAPTASWRAAGSWSTCSCSRTSAWPSTSTTWRPSATPG